VKFLKCNQVVVSWFVTSYSPQVDISLSEGDCAMFICYQGISKLSIPSGSLYLTFNTNRDIYVLKNSIQLKRTDLDVMSLITYLPNTLIPVVNHNFHVRKPYE
jgi:hypothetical protein